MGKLFSLVLPLLIGIPAGIPWAQSQVGPQGLQGPVRAVHVEKAQFAMVAGEWREKLPVLSEEIYYDTEGNEVERIRYHERRRSSRRLYFYDPEGNMAESVRYDGRGRLTSKRSFTYDAQGHLVEEASHRIDGSLIEKTVNLYDEEGLQIEEQSYDTRGELVVKIVFMHDDEGRPTEVNFYAGSHTTRPALRKGDISLWLREKAPPGSLLSKIVFTYDAKGYPAETRSYSAQGLLTNKVSYSFVDGHETFSEQLEYHPDGWVSGGKRRQMEEADSFGNETKITIFGWDKSTGQFVPDEVVYKTYTYY